MIGQHSQAVKLVCAFLILVVLAVFVSPLPFAQRAAAQAPEDWDIIVDNSLNEGAIEGEVSNIQTGTDLVRGNIVVTNTKSLWWKVYVSVVGDVDIDTSSLFVDENGCYFLLAPHGNSATDAIPPLPSPVTFHQPGSAAFFYADRTINSGYEALCLQVSDIALIALTGSGVPASAVELALQTLQAPAFVEAAHALGKDPPDLLGAIGAISGIASDSMALAQLQYLLSQLGVNMSIQQIADVFCILRIFQELVVIYDLFTSPFADNVAFKAVGGEDKPLIAAINCSPTSGNAPLVVDFDASDSYAPQYPIELYEWDFGDGGTATGVTTTHAYSNSGKYTVTLTVIDAQSRQSTAKRSIAVYQQRLQVTGGTDMFRLTFEAEDSPIALTYSWDFGDGSTAESKVVEHTYASAGEYVVIVSLGLDTGNTTQGWVPWVAWDTIKVTIEEDPSPPGWHFTVDEYDSGHETVALDGIIVEDADEVWTNSLEHSADLDSVAQNVAPRIVVEYSDSLSEFGLQGSEDLNQVADAVPPRIAVEYADSIAEFSLQGSGDLDLVASAVMPRIVVEYADSMVEFSLQGSEDLEQVAGAVATRIIVEYADSVFSTKLERPLLFDELPDIGPIDDIDFGDVAVGTSLGKTTTIYNYGSAKLTINSIARISGDSDFSYIGPTTPLDIGAGGSQEITIQFGPYSLGSRTATFNVTSNDPDEPQVPFNVSGNAYILGDANMDGLVNIGDVTYIELIILGYREPLCFVCADANQDGVINMGDVIYIELMILGLWPPE